MFFSVIVPVYKVEKYLKSCIESVLSQNFSDFELILVDDGSPDCCPQICDAYREQDRRIKVIHKENGGLASARRAGILVAKGEYVFNLDSDDRIESDTLELAHRYIESTNCEIVSLSYKWVKGDQVVSVTNDGLDEGFYGEAEIKSKIFPRLLMDRDMNHISYYLSGKAVKRTLLTPQQLAVNESLTLGEDLCCTVPCYLHAKGVYISKRSAYLYTVREDSISKGFNSKQILLVENVIREITKLVGDRLSDFNEQLCRYSAFMCFAILAAAAEGGYKESVKELSGYILNSVNHSCIEKASFKRITPKSKITIFLMKQQYYKAAFYFLFFCKRIKDITKRRPFREA